MKLFRLAMSVVIDGALTLVSGGCWLGMAQSFDGTFTEREMAHQRNMELLKEACKAIEEIGSETKRTSS